MNRCFQFILNHLKTLRNAIRRTLAMFSWESHPCVVSHTTACRSIIMPTLHHCQALAKYFYRSIIFARISLVMAYCLKGS